MTNIDRRRMITGIGLTGAALAATGLATPSAGATTIAAPAAPAAAAPTGLPLVVTAYGAKGDGVSDDTAAVRAAIAAVPAAGGTVFFPAGTYLIGETISLRSRLTLVGDRATLVLNRAPTTSSQTLLLAENVEDVTVRNLGFRFPTSRMWSVLVRRGRRIAIRECRADGGHLVTVMGPIPQDLPSPQVTAADINTDIVVEDNVLAGVRDFQNRDGAITVRYTDRFRVSGNSITGYSHGVQWWGGDSAIEKDGAVGNERKVKHGVVSGNTVVGVNKGGIWGSMGTQIAVTGNVVDTAGDVGIDFEGCFQCTATGNTVVDARYAGLAIFFNNRDIVFAGNTVLATVPLTEWMFWVANGGNSPDNRSVSLVGNSFLDQSGKIGKVGGSYVESVQFADNNLRNVRIELTMRGFAHSVTDNQLFFDLTATAPFDACHVGGDRNDGTTKVIGNSVRSLVTQPAGSTAIRVSQADPDHGTRSLVQSNITAGFPTDVLAYTNSPNAALRHRFVVKDNILGAGTVLRTDNGAARSLVLLEDNVTDAGLPYPGAIPTAGTWDRGQQIRFAEPSAGGHIGAVCVSAGTPGQWRNFGAIAP
ncbi:hypothetical protein GIS00_25005 [Nakamurella sp. YIM 132087]|uniref:Pectate lyase superfamily protein domain-containing protein n=1 Tax=Nakamurella alba TaxID=2665158 RepID=A0A7K1FSU4_9ACTN|nr:right-handed parallel beta-helix repeat-containing protein [Nakamurella alba]MTD17198.1 hypothetical protein [Nakamurella alba]